jgi:hypothetical protein
MKNSKLFISLLVIAFIGYAAGAFFESFAIGLAVATALTAFGMIPRAQGALFMATPDTSALAAYAGSYEQRLFSTLRARLTLLDDLTVLPGIKNTLKLTKLTVKDGVRGYREAFDAADDDLAYSGRDISTTLLKRDLLINPIKYRSTWMSAAMQPGVNVGDIPFAPFVNDAIMKQVASEIQRGAYFATLGDLSSLSTSFNGLGTIIGAEVTGGGLVPVATGAITASNAVANFEKMVTAMPVEFVEDGFQIFSSVDNARNYNKNYRELYGKYQAEDHDGNLIIDSTAGKVTVKPCNWMGTSGRLIASPKENLIAGLDALGDSDKIITHIQLEIIQYRILFALGFQIRDLKALRVNDVA